ncbi:MAG: TonB-dependent receptor [Gammaproteobacteria bacterium]|nr:TonB-dependent receptor [Gammaproteobacteria bacterium]
MNISVVRTALVCAVSMNISFAHGSSDLDELNKKLDKYEQRIEALERKDAETARSQSGSTEYSRRKTTNNQFNPAISVIIDGVYASYKNNPEDYQIPGFALGGEAELSPEGFSLGHSEIVFSNNIDDKFYGQFTLAFAEHDNEIEVELEEAFFETLSLGGGFTIRGGRFYSALGYLNQQHEHAWDFKDAPLVYRALFGNQYFDDGLRLSVIMPTDLFLEFGAEALSGRKYPAGGEHDGVGSWVAYANIGGDIGVSHSWQAGASYWSADRIEREYGGHSHGGTAETPLFEGDSKTIGLNAVYKWAPDGNYRERNVKLQFEYFDRNDEGNLTLLDSIPLETSTLDSRQDGWYAQATWKFARSWRTGIRYDRLDSDNKGSDPGVLDEAGLLSNGHTPKRASVMAEWVPSEYSRLRLQYNRDDSYQVSDDQVFLQYTFSIGAHGAHAF